jgi:hypothetical protein
MIKLAPPLPLRFCLRAVGLLAAIVAAGSTSVRAEVDVQGDLAAVRLKANQAPVSEVLSALGAAFNVRYRSSISLDATIDITYTGPLARVLPRVLDGYNYVIKKEGETIEVLVFGRQGDRPTAVEPPKPSPGRNSATQWRMRPEKSTAGQRQ